MRSMVWYTVQTIRDDGSGPQQTTRLTKIEQYI
jgi:hypothetical protein